MAVSTPSMEHKGIEYGIVHTTSPDGWRWIVYLPGRQPKTGTSSSREIALGLAQAAIDRAVKVKRTKPIAKK
ncbi:hypothetical protein [Bradyrhizobium sp. JYMT SZCCT0180]|uniref:hypothetical protein n=1 Tax=Bradyrhizobium sp. JYMT SZCCT0180 TaxID=2807666 RepID=UPI001BA8EAB8|nr:hypothetical protein [Bradyrhizobium sp. JYMT SZCCT0180]MBR1215591.1 hypothetical protein [Bradyrhizobium sp. JYMT SZCCT0180]